MSANDVSGDKILKRVQNDSRAYGNAPTGFAADVDTSPYGAVNSPLWTERAEFVNEHSEFTNSGEVISSYDKLTSLHEPYTFPQTSDKVYQINTATETDYNFTMSHLDEDGNSVVDYYRIDLDLSKLGTTGNTTFSTAGDYSFEIKYKYHPKTVYYTITQRDDYTLATTRVNDTLASSNLNKVLFKDFTGSDRLVYNYNKDNSTVNIIADFVHNTISSSYIDGWLIGNYAYDSNSTASMGNITGNFIGNYISSYSSSIFGGMIGNYGTASMGAITGDFIGNYISSPSYIRGGLIGNYAYNSNSTASMGNITGNFIGNYISSPSSYIYGGLICNYAYNSNSTASMGAITGDFIGNRIFSSGSYSSIFGGMICNYSYYSCTATMGDITGDFIGNYVSASSSSIDGGLIANCAYAYFSTATVSMGAISGDFIGNYVSASSSINGGLICNKSYASYSNSTATATMGDITGDFIGNYISSSSIYGGVIYNYANAYSLTATVSMGAISGDFIGNYVSASYSIKGGLIYNYSFYSCTATMGAISGDFIGNYVSASSSYINGGLICNDSYGYSSNSTATAKMGAISGDFIGNYISSSSYIYGGLIGNYGTASMGAITGDFIGNYISSSSYIYGGVICNYGIASMGAISGDFIGNYISSSSYIYGGLIGNYAYAYAYSSNSTATANMGNITGNFTNNSITAGNYVYGGVIYNSGTIGEKDDSGNVVGGIINSSFIGNYVKVSEGGSVQGAAIWTNKDLNIIADNGVSEFTGNYAQIGDGEKDYTAIYLTGARTSTSADSVGLTGTLYTINAQSTLNLIAKNNGSIILNDKIQASNYLPAKWTSDSRSQTINGSSRSVYTYNILDKDNNITDSVRYYSTFDYQTINGESQWVTTYNILDKDNNITDSVRYYSTSGYQTINGESQCVITYNILDKDNNVADSVRYYSTSSSEEGIEIYTYYILDDENNIVKTFDSPSSKFPMAQRAQMKYYGGELPTVAIQGDGTGTVYLYNDIKNAVVTANNVTLNTVNNDIHEYNFNSFTLTGNTNMVVDVDLVNESMDRIIANEYGTHNGTLAVTGMNLLSDSKSARTTILFAENGLKDNVVTTVTKVGANAQNRYQTKAFAPIFKYDVSYNTTEEGGFFTFVRGSGSTAADFNPVVLSTPVAQLTGAVVTQTQTFNYAFQHSDMFMNLPVGERIASKNRNKYALDNVGVFSPLMTGAEDTGYWVKPYATFENLPLKNGPKVNAISYGTLIGHDEMMVSMKHGWDRVVTYYIGYNGASQNYSHTDTYQNGGLAGATLTLYKGNFFNATTISAGASVGENQTMFGTDYSTSFYAGVGNKTGYNIEFQEGRYIIQPSMLLSYTFINTFDYTNSAGVRINSDPTSMIQVSPTVRFVMNTKNGWQPYLAVGMVWNITAHSDIRANGVMLPGMSIKPYVQYGLGVQKRFKDRFTAFGQAMIYNAGRNGVSLSAGLRWAIGK